MTVPENTLRTGATHALSFESRATERRMTVHVITPPGDCETGIARPVLYFLHPWGLSPRYLIDKLRMVEHLWQGVERGALPPFVIALPEGGKSFYVNALDPPGHDWSPVVRSQPAFFAHALEQYGRYGDYLWDEVMPAVEERFGVRSDRAGRAIGGISMGGAAAAYHAFRAPEAFCAAGIHSPAVFQGPPEQGGPPWIFGLTQETFAQYNPADLARGLAPEDQPRLWLDCGDRDNLLHNVEHLHQALAEQGLAHEYSIRPGGHDKTYWTPRMPDYLEFYAREWQPDP